MNHFVIIHTTKNLPDCETSYVGELLEELVYKKELEYTPICLHLSDVDIICCSSVDMTRDKLMDFIRSKVPRGVQFMIIQTNKMTTAWTDPYNIEQLRKFNTIIQRTTKK